MSFFVVELFKNVLLFPKDYINYEQLKLYTISMRCRDYLRYNLKSK